MADEENPPSDVPSEEDKTADDKGKIQFKVVAKVESEADVEVVDISAVPEDDIETAEPAVEPVETVETVETPKDPFQLDEPPPDFSQMYADSDAITETSERRQYDKYLGDYEDEDEAYEDYPFDTDIDAYVKKMRRHGHLDSDLSSLEGYDRIYSIMGGETQEYLGSEKLSISEISEEPVIVDTSTPIDREYYVDQYRELHAQRIRLRQKNGILNKKIIEYYRKRKMDRVFDEIPADVYGDMLLKYERKIDDFYEFRMSIERRKSEIHDELLEMRKHRDELKDLLKGNFASMLAREKEVGVGLIDTRTGKSISEKAISTLVSRQNQKSKQIGEIRLGYIKKRDKVRKLEGRIKALETISGNIKLIDYEQLRMENQMYNDKLEEREEELFKLRTRFSKTLQTLAHVRLKLNTAEEEIEDYEDSNIEKELEMVQAREYLTNLKIERDSNRTLSADLQLNSGLLTHTRLLQDMELTIKQVDDANVLLQKTKATCKSNRYKIAAIKSRIENFKNDDDDD